MDLGDSSIIPLKLLGAGSFGRVFACKHRSTNDIVCVKRIAVQNPKQDMKMIMEEVYIISQLRHPNIIKFIDSFVHAGTVNIVMEYAPKGTLLNVIKQSRLKGFTNETILFYFSDILMGLEYLHIRHVFHRDLKPANLLININNRIQIADFGISLIHTPNRTIANNAGTAYYSAPEVMRGEKYDYKSDIWSLGCILYEMCVGYSPFSCATDMENLVHLIKTLTHPTLKCDFIRKKYGHLWAYLCEKMIVINLPQRISLPDILSLDPKLTLPYYNKYFDYKY